MATRPYADRNQLEEYVERELREATPSGWRWFRKERGRLWWTIERTSIPVGEWSTQEFDLHVSEDLDWLMVTYGNKDIGPLSLQQEFQNARIIQAPSLERFPLRSCIQFIIERCKPNEWGYT